MNDDPTLDELVSAYLDGEATADEVARVEQSADLTARAATLRSVRDAVAAPVGPPPDGHRDQAVSAALRASSTAANVTSLATHQGRSARAMRLASIAAVIAVFMLAGSLVLLSRDSGDRDETVASADAAAEASDAVLDSAADGDLRSPDESTEAPAEEPASESPVEAEAMADEAMGETSEPAAEEPAAAEEAAPLAEVAGPLRVALPPQTDPGDLADVLLARIESPDDDAAFDAEAPLPACTIAFIDGLDGEVIGATETTLSGLEVGAVAYLAPDRPTTRIVAIFELDAPACVPVSIIER